MQLLLSVSFFLLFVVIIRIIKHTIFEGIQFITYNYLKINNIKSKYENAKVPDNIKVTEIFQG